MIWWRCEECGARNEYDETDIDLNNCWCVKCGCKPQMEKLLMTAIAESKMELLKFYDSSQYYSRELKEINKIIDKAEHRLQKIKEINDIKLIIEQAKEQISSINTKENIDKQKKPKAGSNASDTSSAKKEVQKKDTGHKPGKIRGYVLGLMIVAVLAIILFNSHKKMDSYEASGNDSQNSLSDRFAELPEEGEDVEEESAQEEVFQEERDMVFPDSNSRYLTEDEIESLSLEELKIAINEVYARHGRKFKDESLMAYFESKSWYEGYIEPDDFSMDIFNDYEVKNLDLMSARRSELQ